MKTILNKILTRLQKKWFEYGVASVVNTKPIQYTKDSTVTIVTMLGHNAVLMYLVAIKSFIQQFGYGSIEVINDGSLTNTDIKLLNHHIPNINFSKATEVNTLTCPSYISWKRLLRIAELAKHSYVIQLDSDTISLAPLVDIHNKVQANEGFIIGSEKWKQGLDVDFLHRNLLILKKIMSHFWVGQVGI